MNQPESSASKSGPEPSQAPPVTVSTGARLSAWLSVLVTFIERRRRIVFVLGLVLIVPVVVWLLVSTKAHPPPLPETLAGVALLVVLVLWKLPKRQAAHSQGLTSDNRFDRENEARKTLAQIIGGVFLLAGLYTSLQTFSLQQHAFDLQREGQIADRFTKAIEQLGAVLPNSVRDAGVEPRPNLTVRLGGIYALEQISIDSPGYFETVMEILSNYVRQYSPAPTRTNESGIKYDYCPVFDLFSGNVPDPPRVDIQAILDAIGRRKIVGTHSAGRINLVETNLDRADMGGKNLQGVDFTQACLSATNFESAHLEGTIFSGASLGHARFTAAHLDGTQFKDASLSEAWLRGGVDLTKALGLCRGRVQDTLTDQRTKFPELPAC